MTPSAIAAEIVIWMLSAAILTAATRMALGPTAADRVAAFDLTGVLVVGIIGAHAVRSGESEYVDAAVIIALIAFLGTVALARFIRRTRRQDR